MSESSEQDSDSESEQDKNETNESKDIIRRNLSNFLNPGFPLRAKAAPDSEATLHLRMAQMELANRMRMRSTDSGKSSHSAPKRAAPPAGGYGSAAGMFHMKKGDFGKKAQAAPTGKVSPYQQVLANSSSGEQNDTAGSGDEVIEIPSEAEFKQNSVQKPKKGRGKRFQNPSL